MLTVCECTSVSLINLDLEIVFRVLLGIRDTEDSLQRIIPFLDGTSPLSLLGKHLAISSFVSVYST
jgi:hypothetical protein